MAALIAALAGTAVAVDKITSKDIAKNAVRSKHIKKNQVKAKDANLLRFSVARGEVTRPGVSGNGGEPGDPRLAVRAKPGDVLILHGRVDIRRDAGSGRCNANFLLSGPGDSLLSSRFAASESEGAFETVFADPEQDSVSGTTNRARAESRELPVLDGGRYGLGIAYDQGNSGTDCTYRNRALWLGVIR